MERFHKDLYDFVYGSGKGKTVVRKRRNYKIAASLGAAVLASGMVAAGIGVIQGVLLLGLAALCIWIVPELLLYQRVETVKLSVRMDLPNFLDVIALLLEAGQPLWYAVRVAGEIGDSELCRRISGVFQSGGSMETGRNPEVLLEQFAAELRMPEITSAVAAIVQNSRKGEKELAGVLRMQSSICRQERRYLAEELGNRASNLMLIPSGMVFIAILTMLIAPAIMQLSIF